jgi:hypothetical protein
VSHPQGTGRTVSQERTIGQLVVDATRDLSLLLRAEVALAKAELAQEAKQGVIGASLFIAAGVMGLLGTILFLLFLVYGLFYLGVDLWLAYLIVAVVLLAIAGILAAIGLGRVKKVGPPVRTVETSKRSIAALKGRH